LEKKKREGSSGRKEGRSLEIPRGDHGSIERRRSVDKKKEV